jgi:acetyltransferase
VVNPRYPEIEGIRTVPSLTALHQAPDLVVIAAPASEVPAIVAQAGQSGTPSAIIITAGLGHGEGSLAETCEKAARQTGLRLVGPNCIGVIAPAAKLNASFAAHAPQPGDLALISQSGAVAAGLVEWAATRRSATASMSTSAIRSTISRSTAARARSCSTLNRFATRASSCRRHAQPRA